MLIVMLLLLLLLLVVVVVVEDQYDTSLTVEQRLCLLHDLTDDRRDPS